MRPLTAKEYREAKQQRDLARDHFIRAAAALTAWEGDPEAFALVEATRGLICLATADVDQRARVRVETWLASVRSAAGR